MADEESTVSLEHLDKTFTSIKSIASGDIVQIKGGYVNFTLNTKVQTKASYGSIYDFWMLQCGTSTCQSPNKLCNGVCISGNTCCGTAPYCFEGEWDECSNEEYYQRMTATSPSSSHPYPVDCPQRKYNCAKWFCQTQRSCNQISERGCLQGK